MVDLIDRLVVLVPDTDIQGQVWKHLPVVLHKVGIAPGAHANRTSNASDTGEAGTVQQKVRCRVAGVRRIYVRGSSSRAQVEESSHGAVVAGIEVILLLTQKLHAELQGVLA